MVFQHKLSSLFFSAIVAILLLLLLVIYSYAVPLINQQSYASERNASRLVLNNVSDMANNIEQHLTTYKNDAINAHKRNLIAVIELAQSYIETSLASALHQQLSREQALQQVYAGLRDLSYGNGSYIWLADKNARILSHPDPLFDGVDASTLSGSQGPFLLPDMIDEAQQQGDGFYQYPWRKHGEHHDNDKLSYIKYLPQWGLFIGSGVNIADIEQEVASRRQQVIGQLRQTIEQIVIAKTGYLFIFNKQGDMLLHPNANIEATNALALKNPLSGQPILQELMAVADTGNELTYKWDRPTDPNNYSYDKLSLVRYLDGLGWYLCSSVYVDELQASGELLSQRILTLGLFALGVAIMLVYFFARWVTRPISLLAQQALRVRQGDLTVNSGITRADELGVLGRAFDSMVLQLRHNITNLDQQVASRTQALHASNQQLQQAIETTQQTQMQLIHAQRMHAVGQLAGGLAHDFNNILTIILGNLTAAEQRYANHAELLTRLRPAIRASRRGNDITTRLLAFSRGQSLSPLRLDVTELMNETIELFRGSLASTIAIQTQFVAPLHAYVDPNQLENCLINLLLNAKDAMPKGGIIHLRGDRQRISDGEVYDEAVRPGQYIVITLQDTGSGFDNTSIDMACEPFYTTKSAGKGAGLGLSMVFGFVKQSAGYIKFANADCGGALVSILLPICLSGDQSAAAMPVTGVTTELAADVTTDIAAGATTGIAGRATALAPSASANCAKANRQADKLILLVEDDADVRTVLREQLIALGYQIIEAADSDEAVTLIAALSPLYGLVTDVNMPGAKDGVELAGYFQHLSPKSPVVVMSADNITAQRSLPASWTFLAKPFLASDLANALANAS